MFENLWILFCFFIPALTSTGFVGALAVSGWVRVVAEKGIRVSGSLIALSASVFFDAMSVLNYYVGEKLFPMTAYGGDFRPFFSRWQIISAVLLLLAVAFLIVDRRKSNRWELWGTILQSLIHCCEFELSFLLLRH